MSVISRQPQDLSNISLICEESSRYICRCLQNAIEIEYTKKRSRTRGRVEGGYDRLHNVVVGDDCEIRRRLLELRVSDIIIACTKSHHNGVAYTAGSHYGFRTAAKLQINCHLKGITARCCFDSVLGPPLLAAQLAFRLRSDQRLLQSGQPQVWISRVLFVTQSSAYKYDYTVRATANSMDCRAHGKVQPHTGTWSCRLDTFHRQNSLRQESERECPRNTQPECHHSGQCYVGARWCSLHQGV